jgi:hypothetical protein
MKLKIFKPLLITIAIVTGLHGLTLGQQAMTAEQQKDLETRMKQMEQKLQQMQVKLDSMKQLEKKHALTAVTVEGYSSASPRAMKISPRISAVRPAAPMTPLKPTAPITVHGFQKGFSEAFSKSSSFNYDASDKKLEEKVKSGEVKEVSKVFSKSYIIDRDDKLVIDNKFGKVTVSTWNKNEFKVDAQIRADAMETDEAQKLLDGVKIDDSKDGSTVSFATKIESNDGNNSWGMGTNNGKPFVRKVYINYTIYMPSKNALQITNRFGGIELPDFDGKVTVNSTYGNFTAKKLTNTANEITTRGATTIESLNGGQLKVQYGSIDVGTAENLSVDANVSPVKIGKIKSAGTINVRYGPGVQINDLDKNLKSLCITTYIAPLDVNFNNNQNFDFDVTVHNNSFDYGNHDVTVTSQSPEEGARKFSPTKTYKGHLGKGNPDKVITVKSNYAPVKFNLQ